MTGKVAVITNNFPPYTYTLNIKMNQFKQNQSRNFEILVWQICSGSMSAICSMKVIIKNYIRNLVLIRKNCVYYGTFTELRRLFRYAMHKFKFVTFCLAKPFLGLWPLHCRIMLSFFGFEFLKWWKGENILKLSKSLFIFHCNWIPSLRYIYICS